MYHTDVCSGVHLSDLLAFVQLFDAIKSGVVHNCVCVGLGLHEYVHDFYTVPLNNDHYSADLSPKSI